MKKINIIGIGMNFKTIPVESLEHIKKSEILIGAKRMVEEFLKFNIKSFVSFDAQKIKNFLDKNDFSVCSILVSGDVGFYSAAKKYIDVLQNYNLEIFPGISTINYFFAKIKRDYENVKFFSMHGRDLDLVGIIRRNLFSFFLCDKKINLVAKKLLEFDFKNLVFYLGENLGYKNEKITKLNLDEMLNYKFSSLCCLLIENKFYDKRICCGIDDDKFIRGKIPMTKQNIRAAIMSKAKIKPKDICLEIGCGTGSVTVELAMHAYEGKVFAIDKNSEAVKLTKKNLYKFKIDNVKLFCDDAVNIISKLPNADFIFIGGSSGKIFELVKLISEKQKNIHIIITTITLETLSESLNCIKQFNFDFEVTEVCIAESKKTSNLTMMISQNPVFIINAWRKNE